MHQLIGKGLMAAGILLVVAGITWFLLGHKLHWIGHLPGDIRVKKEGFSFYFPFTTMILISLLLNLIIKLFKRFIFH